MLNHDVEGQQLVGTFGLGHFVYYTHTVQVVVLRWNYTIHKLLCVVVIPLGQSVYLSLGYGAHFQKAILDQVLWLAFPTAI